MDTNWIGVSPQNFDQINRQREHTTPSRKFRLRRYHANTGILFITIPTKLHEALHCQLYESYRDQLVRSNREESWITIGTATFRRQGHPEGDGGEGDSTGGPVPECASKDGWPTLVIEAGVSEPLNELHNDMKWWFSASDHQVKIVILAKFDRSSQTIILEKWEEEPCVAPRAGATTTRYAASMREVLRQRITMTQDQTTNPVSYNVTSGSLVLSFRLLFLRNPGPGEGDFVIPIPQLQSFARVVWVYV